MSATLTMRARFDVPVQRVHHALTDAGALQTVPTMTKGQGT